MTAAGATPAIEVRGLSKRFGGTQAVDNIDFAIRPGTVTGFLGPNGAGKTTTLRMLLGLARPSSGEARILGRPYADIDDPTRTVGALIEVQGFHPGRTGRNSLRTVASAAGIGSDRVDELLALVGLSAVANRRVGGYSLGMKQRLGLAVAMLGDPQVYVLDEPANGLDPEGVRWMRELLRALAGQGRTVLVSSHVLTEVARIADDVIVIHRGRIITHAPVGELTSTGGAFVRAGEAERLRVALQAAGATVVDDDGGLVVADWSPEQVGEAARDTEIALHELRRRESDLESVFFSLTGDSDGAVADPPLEPEHRSGGREPATTREEG